jgi:hypothetical protein
MPPLYQTKLSAGLSYDFYLFSQWALVPIKVAYTRDLTLIGVGRLFCGMAAGARIKPQVRPREVCKHDHMTLEMWSQEIQAVIECRVRFNDGSSS